MDEKHKGGFGHLMMMMVRKENSHPVLNSQGSHNVSQVRLVKLEQTAKRKFSCLGQPRQGDTHLDDTN
jgi:hypothetical protein